MTGSTPPLFPLNSHKWNGRRVGILGGSFNPPHEGHIHISMVAMNMLQLDYIWWLVTPQNPLKSDIKPQSFENRFSACCALTKHHPRFLVSDFEKRLGLNYTADTVDALTHCYPKTKFAFIMGMDNALTFHKWERWREILDKMATAHIARPPFYNMVESSPLRSLATQRHIFLERGHRVSLKPRTSYWIMQNHLMNISSSNIRSKSSK